MRFWDSSVVVALLVDDARSVVAETWLREDPDLVVWWAAEIECASAICRLERDGVLEPGGARRALVRLRRLAGAWNEIEPTDAVRRAALRILRLHSLRAADALQLAAAFVAAEGDPGSLTLVTFDARLAAAAEREGFVLLGESV